MKKRYSKIKQTYIDNGQFWPRHEAIRIIKLDTKEEMQEALKNVKPVYKDWVKFYLNDWMQKAGGLANLKRMIK